MVATADFFTPIVDDARIWGRISATNAVSDVYAMGGKPLFALNLVAWPRDELSLELLGEVMAGGADAASAGGWVIAGGHTVDGPEPMYGQSVIGQVDPTRVLTNAQGRAGDVLILTKPIGTGLIATAVKASDPEDVLPAGWLHDSYSAAVDEMTRLNRAAAEIALSSGAEAATDITGFGLLGHLQRLAAASALQARVDVSAVPLLPRARQLLADGYVPGGTRRNLDAVSVHLSGGSDDDRLLLADAQTSGGLLFGCGADHVDETLARLVDEGHSCAAIGILEPGESGTIILV